MGKAKNLRDRVSSYFAKPSTLLPKTALLVEEIVKIDHIDVESEIDAFLLEANLIKKYCPKYNLIGKDDKSYPYIEIDVKSPIPLVKIVRQQTNPKNRYFGPYPPGSDAARLLRFLRHIFPFVSQKHKKGEICLRSHLGLCPCADLSVYPKNLKNLMDFLSGKRLSVQKNLEKEMEAYSQKQEYEKAALIKEQLQKLAYLTAPRTNPWEYQKNPNLVSDRRNLEIGELEKILGLSNLNKIEAYDIANISGKFASGSQVVFVGGVPEKKFYRRYKITTKDAPDDYAMIREVLTRRLKSDVPLPDLFVIDGGKGQLNVALSIISKRPVIALAKREEEIYTQDGKIIRLPKNSAALHLLQRLRDEAHRFSRKYHFLLRRNNMLA